MTGSRRLPRLNLDVWRTTDAARHAYGATTVTLIDQANTNFAGALIPANNSAGNYIRLSVTGTAFE